MDTHFAFTADKTWKRKVKTHGIGAFSPWTAERSTKKPRPIRPRLCDAQDRDRTIGDSAEKSSDSAPGAAKSAAIDPDIAELAAKWPSLPAIIKSAILAVARPHLGKE